MKIDSPSKLTGRWTPDIRARLERMATRYVEDPYETEIRQALEAHIATGTIGRSKERSARGFLLTGESRTGKSALIQKLSEGFPAYTLQIPEKFEVRDIRPLVYVKTPNNATSRQLLMALCFALGELDVRGSETELAQRVKELVADLLVQVVVLDEVHHLVEGLGATGWKVDAAARALKTFLELLGCAVVIVGTPFHSRLLLTGDRDQARFRTDYEFELMPLDWNNPKDRLISQSLLHLLEQEAFGPITNLRLEKHSRRIHEYAGGRRGRMAEIAIKATVLTFQRGETMISDQILADAFATFPKVGGHYNPYLLESKPQQPVRSIPNDAKVGVRRGKRGVRASDIVPPRR